MQLGRISTLHSSGCGKITVGMEVMIMTRLHLTGGTGIIHQLHRGGRTGIIHQLHSGGRESPQLLVVGGHGRQLLLPATFGATGENKYRVEGTYRYCLTVHAIDNTKYFWKV